MRNALILGSGRSGTSMLAGTLASAGAWVGDDPYPPRAANPKGFFETAEINGINEAILALSLPPDEQLAQWQRWVARMPLERALRAAPDSAQRIRRMVARRAPWCFKDPRLCYTLPLWRPHVGDALHLCVFRAPAATAHSIVRECATEPYLAGVSMDFERALEVWTCMYEHVLRHERAGGEWRFVHCEQLWTPQGIERLESWLDARVAREFPEAGLMRSPAEGHVPERARALYAELCERAGHATGTRVQLVRPEARAAAQPISATTELSVILCTYNRAPILAHSLASFAAQDAPLGSFELVVVDDGSTDGTRELLERTRMEIPLRIVHRENGGLAAARNSGIALARGRLLLFVNDDTIAFPDLVRAHLRAHAERQDEVAVLGTFEQPEAALASALMRAIEHSDLVFRYGEMRHGELYGHNHFWTCNVSVSAAHVRAAGGFDEAFKQYGCEDIDLGIRLAQRGIRVLHDTRARAGHEHVLDYAALERRQRTNAHSFVHLFAKHPACLRDSDWEWLRARTLGDLDNYAAQRAAELPALEAAARTLADVDCAALDAHPASRAASAEIVRALEEHLRELNALWWQAGFARGLRERGLWSFIDLERAATGPGEPAPPALDAATWLAGAKPALQALREQAVAGETCLATIAAIRVAARFDPARMRDDPAALRAYADLLADLGALRYSAEDLEGSRAFLRAALELVPEHKDARANLSDIDIAHPLPPQRWGDGPQAAALPTSLNPWVVEALELARKRAGCEGRRVLEVGGALPRENALATGAAAWIGGYPGAKPVSDGAYEVRAFDARALPFEDESFDVVFSSCAFEHINELDVALAEMQRVLRPGGALVTLFAPIWSYAVGHHLWELDASGRRMMFMDPLLPHFAHLLLEERELAWYLELVFGAETARRCTHYVHHHPCINRVFEGDFQRMFAAAGWDARGIERQPPWSAEHVPSPALRAELLRLHPHGGDFGTPGFKGVLIKTAAAHAAPASIVTELEESHR
jgi:SAM-dependent methyltransferase